MDFKKEIAKLLKTPTKLKQEQIINLLEIPPNPELGDYAFPCFILAKTFKTQPTEIAKQLANLKLPKSIHKLQAVGPYLNIKVNKTIQAQQTLKNIRTKTYGQHKLPQKRILIEFPSPNTNKPLHLGHLRNIFLGQSVTNLLKNTNQKVIKTNLNNDRGIHICKAMVAYDKFGKNQSPNIKPDHFIGKFYVLYNKHKDQLEPKAKQCLIEWENNDKQTRALWKKIRTWAINGFQETYKTLNLTFDKTYNESEIYDKGKEIILKAHKDKILKKDETGAIYADLKKPLGKKYLLRSDNTSIYITQDIYLAYIKNKDFKIHKSIYVVGSEQQYHFQVLFKLLKLLNFKYADNCYHLSYGMVYLPEGRMKSREGTVVDADNLIEDIIALSKQELKKRYPKLKKAELDKRAKTIGLAALKFFILKYDHNKDITFNSKESLSFEGETGPYIQYTHARASSLLKKAKYKYKTPKLNLLTHSLEQALITKLANFPVTTEKAANELKPSLIANYLLDLSRSFNEFYQQCPCIKTEKDLAQARQTLVEATKTVIAKGLSLLEIEAPNEM